MVVHTEHGKQFNIGLGLGVLFDCSAFIKKEDGLFTMCARMRQDQLIYEMWQKQEIRPRPDACDRIEEQLKYRHNFSVLGMLDQKQQSILYECLRHNISGVGWGGVNVENRVPSALIPSESLDILIHENLEYLQMFADSNQYETQNNFLFNTPYNKHEHAPAYKGRNFVHHGRIVDWREIDDKLDHMRCTR